MIDIKEYRAACKDYDKNWAKLNDTLYELCNNHPDQSSLSSINAKFYIIGRTYASGIERIRRDDATLNDLTKFIYKNRSKVIPIFKRLSRIREPLTLKSLKIIVEEHGRFLTILKKGLKGRSPRSFASKYLHFHCPAVPIFDGVANGELSHGQRWNKNLEIFAIPKGADRDYYRFAMRFWRLYNSAREKKLRPTVRGIDCYLLWMAEDK